MNQHQKIKQYANKPTPKDKNMDELTLEEKKFLNKILINCNNRLEEDDTRDDTEKEEIAAMIRSINNKIVKASTSTPKKTEVEVMPKELVVRVEGKPPLVYKMSD